MVVERKQVLDHGFVELLHVAPDDPDQFILGSARVSYQKGTKTVREDFALMDYLIRKKHTSPLEQVVFWFRIKMPIFVARQWVRHRTARLNEVSARYSVLPAETYIPKLDVIKGQDKVNKQGSAGELPMDVKERFQETCQITSQDCFADYGDFLDDGVSRELARINLPLSTYTEMVWQMDLHNLAHFLSLRLDSHAQYEIRCYAEAMAEFVKQACPMAWESYYDNHITGVNFSGKEMKAISAFFGDKDFLDLKELLEIMYPEWSENRRQETLDKVKRSAS